jgi:hypothetical protein
VKTTFWYVNAKVILKEIFGTEECTCLRARACVFVRRCDLFYAVKDIVVET